MTKINNRPVKRHVRRMRKFAMNHEKTAAMTDCWGERVGCICRNGSCIADNLSKRQIVHIVAGSIVALPRAARSLAAVQALRNIRLTMNEWNTARGLV